MGEPKEKIRAMFLEKMIQPVGRPPAVSDVVVIVCRDEMWVEDGDADLGCRLRIETEGGCWC